MFEAVTGTGMRLSLAPNNEADDADDNVDLDVEVEVEVEVDVGADADEGEGEGEGLADDPIRAPVFAPITCPSADVVDA